jgi:glycosyltransferase involved in cell wall biosynthesis
MKIAYEFGNLWGGAPLSLREYARLAKNAGNDVYAITDSLNYRYVVDDYDIPVEVRPEFRIQRPDQVLRLASWYRRHIEEFKPDLIHSTRPDTIIPLSFGLEYRNMPILLHNASPIMHFPKIYKFSKNLQWITYNEEFFNNLLKAGVTESNIQIIPNRFNFERIARCSTVSRREKKVVWLGRLTERKSRSAFSVINTIASQLLDYSLEFIGDGEIEEELRSHVNTFPKEVRDRVNFRGHCENPEKWLASAEIVVGLGRCAVEGLVSGCIVLLPTEKGGAITVREANLQKLASSNFSGRGFQQYSVSEAFKDALTLLTCDQSKAKIAHEVDKMFSIDWAKDRILDVYASIKANPARVPSRFYSVWCSVLVALDHIMKTRAGRTH